MRPSIKKMNSVFMPVSFLCLIFLTSMPSRSAAGFPDKPIKIVVPFAPGGGIDLMARMLADFMSKDLGKKVVIENNPVLELSLEQRQSLAAPPTVIHC